MTTSCSSRPTSFPMAPPASSPSAASPASTTRTSSMAPTTIRPSSRRPAAAPSALPTSTRRTPSRSSPSSASGYSAEFGGAAGGIINAITKSGTNQMHGDLFYYLRYPALNALDPYSKYSGCINGESLPAHPDRSSAAAVRRLRRRPHHQGQALLLLHL